MNLEDIARKAGVSRSTVSRVVNDDPRVSDETRQRVQDVIRRERFQPNSTARALVTRRTEILGVVIPTNENIFFTDNSYFPMLVAGMNDVMREADYGMLFWLAQVASHHDKLMSKIRGRVVDGVIFASLTENHPLFTYLTEIPVPFVSIDKPVRHANAFNYVSVDNIHAAETATEHLIRLGRTRIAHITGNMDISDAQERLQGYKNALKRAGYPVESTLIAEGRFRIEAGYQLMQTLLQYRPDALFAAGDTIAQGALRAIQESGLRVPEDIAVVGFDDIDVALLTYPTLTTIRQPVQEKGAAAARLLIDIVEGRIEAPQHIMLPTELIIRDSCGGLRS
jgi:LacI family transcriptional regulator